jgi:tetratricopeptide (TPR) repeat protein
MRFKPFSSRLALVALGILTVSASPVDEAGDWERRGNTAFDDGRFAQAVECYQKAEDVGDQPGRVAFNHGVALFQQGKYRDAERFFRCALESEAPPGRKARALYNLGTCLINVAEGKDAERLAEAISCFHRCLNGGALPEDLLTDSRINLELAKLLWRRVRNGDSPPADHNPAENQDQPSPDRPPESGLPDEAGQQRGGPDGSGGRRLAPGQSGPGGAQPTPTNQGPPPGAGHTQPIPDSEQAKPLPPNEARELIRLADERIRRERRALQRSPAPGEGKNYPDW